MVLKESCLPVWNINFSTLFTNLDIPDIVVCHQRANVCSEWMLFSIYGSISYYPRHLVITEFVVVTQNES